MTTPTLAHAQAAARLRLVIARLNRQMRQQTVGELTLSQWSALVTVDTHGPLRIGDIAEREGVSAPTATRLVASLEELVLVERETDVSDRRSSHVSLTEQGRQQLEMARQARTAKLAQRLSTLSEQDIRRLVDVLPLLEELAAEEAG
jgi:DNA-binding MarR family transcriptional regulator